MKKWDWLWVLLAVALLAGRVPLLDWLVVALGMAVFFARWLRRKPAGAPHSM